MVDYAVLEPNGSLSVILKAEYQTPAFRDMNLPYQTAGIAHPVIMNGELNMQAISEAGKTSEWVFKALNSQGYNILSDIFFMSVDDSDKIYICPVKKTQKVKKI
jgi:uncharacterized membrane protein YcaP (DUF421 family)